MKRTRRHNRPMLTLGIVCLATVAMMLAGPAMAALPALIDCGEACCCPSADRDASPAIRNARSVAADCCRPDGEIACRMTAGNRPSAPMAAHRPVSEPCTDAGQALASNHRPVAEPPVCDPPSAWLGQGPGPDPFPIYLTTCRLIR